jgi:hypothetical protein
MAEPMHISKCNPYGSSLFDNSVSKYVIELQCNITEDLGLHGVLIRIRNADIDKKQDEATHK